MLRRPLLVAALLALLAFAAQQSSGASPGIRNGRIAYDHVGGGNRLQIYTITATGAHRRQLTASKRYSSYEPAYSPRGKRIVFVRACKQDDLWTMNANGSGKRRLTSTAGEDETSPSWSPDGSEIAFEVQKPVAALGIWIVGSDGHGARRLTNGVDSHPTWSPDGSEIAFARAGAIYSVPAAGGTPTQLTFPGSDADGEPFVDLEPAWSPVGSVILFASSRGDPTESADQLDLWAMNADGSDLRHVTNTPSRDERNPAWSPNGRQIAYSGEGSFHGASSSQIYVSNANGANRRILTHACGACAYINDSPSWRPLP
jgi:TolB protein